MGSESKAYISGSSLRSFMLKVAIKFYELEFDNFHDQMTLALKSVKIAVYEFTFSSLNLIPSIVR